MSQVTLAALLAALAVAVAVRSPSAAVGRLRARRRRILPAWLAAEWGRRRQAPEHAQLAVELPPALEFLAVCLAAGQPMARAAETVARVSPPATQRLLLQVSAQLALGRAGPAAWQELRGHPVWGSPAADIARAERSGASLAEALRAHAEDARQESRDAALKSARSVGVRSAIPLMVCFLPAFILIGVVPIVAGLLKGFLGGL